MEIRFRSRRLERAYRTADRAAREWGPEVGRRYVQRIEALRAAERLDDLFAIRALDLHPLRGDRRGQYAIRLTGVLRLIVSVDRDRRLITVEEVTDYHG